VPCDPSPQSAGKNQRFFSDHPQYRQLEDIYENTLEHRDFDYIDLKTFSRAHAHAAWPRTGLSSRMRPKRNGFDWCLIAAKPIGNPIWTRWRAGPAMPRADADPAVTGRSLKVADLSDPVATSRPVSST